MSKTLRFGTRVNPVLTSRIDRHVIRRHTTCGYDRTMELAAQDFARHVAWEVTPYLAGKPKVRYNGPAKPFGKRIG